MESETQICAQELFGTGVAVAVDLALERRRPRAVPTLRESPLVHLRLPQLLELSETGVSETGLSLIGLSLIR